MFYELSVFETTISPMKAYRSPKPCRTTTSRSSALRRPSATRFTLSLRTAYCSRLSAKPGTSRESDTGTCPTEVIISLDKNSTWC